ncbi:D-inositol-3-phosphate glycosyltransferase [compost metagenome]
MSANVKSQVESCAPAVRVHMLVWNDFRNDARVLKEAQTLQAAGYVVVVHALHVPGLTAQREFLDSGIEVRRVPPSPFWFNSASLFRAEGRLSLVLKALSRLWGHCLLVWRLIRAGAQVIHAHDVNTLPTAWLAAKLSAASLVYDAHEISSSREGYRSISRFVGALEACLIPRAVGTITTTDARAKFFSRTYGIPRPLVLQNRPRYQTLTPSHRIRHELNLTKPWPVILYQGGLQPGRGLELLLRAVMQVPEAYLVYIGGGSLASQLREVREELGLQERVHFIPTVALADLPSYTASADIGVQPIENTCFNHFTTDSNKLFEYVQAGLPVIASDLPEIRKVVACNRLGILVPPGDGDYLVSALRDLVADKYKRDFYAENARKAASLLTWEEQEGKLIAFYERIKAWRR